jgi:hypothetical protein
MVDDNDIDPEALRQQDRPLRIDPVVNRDQQVRSAARKEMDSWRTQPVALVPVR